MSKHLIFKTPNVKTPKNKTSKVSKHLMSKTTKNKTSKVSKHLILKTPNVEIPKKTYKVSKHLFLKHLMSKYLKKTYKVSKHLFLKHLMSKHLKTIHTKCQKGSNIQDFIFPSYLKIIFRYFCSKRMQHVGSVGISRNLFKSKMFTF